MSDIILPIISDPYYMKSTWYQEIISGIKSASKMIRQQISVHIFSEPVNEIDVSSLPPIVVVTNGSQRYVKTVINKMVESGKHVVLSGLDSNQFGELISCATSSRRTDMERLVYYLISHDRRHIALVGFWRESINDMLYYHAAMSAAMYYSAPIEKRATYFWHKRLTESLEEFMKHVYQYDAAICPNDTVALCLANHCKAEGIRIPEMLYLTGVSNMQIGRYFDPSLTTISMDFERIGTETFNVWHYIHDHMPKTKSIKVFVPSKLIIRESTDFKKEIQRSFAGSILDDTQDIIEDEVPNNYPQNQFFTDPLITGMMRMENCLHQRDEIDQKILIGIMQGKSYETLAEKLFVSTSTIRYRRNKIFKDADVDTRAAFEHLMRQYIGNIGSSIIE